ncbi:MAG: glycosyl hydrolase 53 family protein [Planctomycetota bacterium]
MAALLLQPLVTERTLANSSFMNGVDISALTLLESDGAQYRNPAGVIGNPLDMLGAEGVDWYRLRLFVDPNGVGQVVNDLDYTLALAQRVNAAGGKLLLDLHYSDTWADPGHQTKPQAWAALDFDELVTQVIDYTRGVVSQFSQAGVTPHAVQIGNEVSNGMLWNDGRLFHTPDRNTELDRFSALLKAGLAGVEQANVGTDPVPEKWIHIADGSNWDASNYLLGELEGRGVDFDLVAFSYYPRFHGTIEGVRTTLEQTSRVYGKPVALAEVGFVHAGEIYEPQADQFVHEVSPQGQRDFAESVVNAVGDVSHDQGRGVFWWHGDAVPTSSGLAWENGRLGLFDPAGRILPAATALGVNPDRDDTRVIHEGNIYHGTPSNAYGQSFRVGLEGADTQPIGGDIELLRVKFVSGGEGVGDLATRLAILRGPSAAVASGTDGPVIVADDPALISLSGNTINTQAAAYGDGLVFEFSNVVVNDDEALTAVFVTEQANGDLTLHQVSNAFISFFESSPGIFDPVSNYGGTTNADMAALYADYTGDGLLDPATNGFDLSFRATFAVHAVPEPGLTAYLCTVWYLNFRRHVMPGR